MTGVARYQIRAQGCDDETVVVMDLTDIEVAAVRKVAERITGASAFDCQPKLYVEEPRADEDEDDE